MGSKIVVKHFSIAVFIFALGVFLAGTPALAQPEEIKSAREDLILSAEKLSQTKDAELTPEKKAERDFELKRAALGKIISFSILETQDIKRRLLIVAEVEAELSVLRDYFLAELEDYLDHLGVAENILKISVDLNAVQKLAADLDGWRESIYNPELKKMMDFVLAFQNKTLLKIADQRFIKMAAEFKKAKTGKLSQTLVLNLLGEAALSLRAARETSNETAKLLLRYLPESQDGESADAPSGQEEILPPEPAENEKPGIRDLIAHSLSKIRDAYKNFIELNDLAKKFSNK